MEKYLRIKLVEAEQDFVSGLTNDMLKGDIYKVIDEDGFEFWLKKDQFEKTYKPIKEWRDKMNVYGENQEYMTRVITEAEELQIKVDKLNDFIEYNKAYPNINIDEQIRLKQQLLAMKYYLTILVERINNF